MQITFSLLYSAVPLEDQTDGLLESGELANVMCSLLTYHL